MAQWRDSKAEGERPPAISPAEFEALVEMIGADLPEVVVDLLETYLEESDKLVSIIASSPADAPTSEMIRAVHSLKSSSASLGAMQLSKLCEDLEAHMRGHGPAVDVADYVQQIVAEYARVRTALESEKEQLLNRVVP